jgi:hypothetical protein
MKTSTAVVAIFLVIVSLVHLLRVILQWKVTINTTEIPISASVAACIITAALAIWIWRENKK